MTNYNTQQFPFTSFIRATGKTDEVNNLIYRELALFIEHNPTSWPTTVTVGKDLLREDLPLWESALLLGRTVWWRDEASFSRGQRS